jgi:ABC-type glycerol-3-phosphate transport system substrate-binding protein
VVRTGFELPDSWSMFVQCLLTTGKTLFRDGRAEFAGTEGIAAMEYLLDIYRGIRPAGATPPTWDWRGIFTGQTAHTWDNTWFVPRIMESSLSDLAQLEVGNPAVPSGGKYVLPSGVRVRPISTNFSDWIAMGSLSKAQDQAWALMQFLVEPAPLAAYVESEGLQVPRRSLADVGFMRQPHVQRLIKLFEQYGHAQIRVPDQALFRGTLIEMGNDVFTGKSSPRAALEQAARLLQAEVDKLGFKGTTL